MDQFVTFLDDLDVERQVPLFSMLSYENDKTAFITDAMEEVKRKITARHLVGPDCITSRVLSASTHLDLTAINGKVKAVMGYKPNFRSAVFTRNIELDVDSSTVVGDLITFIDFFQNVEIVQST
jgi:hypothetical protein